MPPSATLGFTKLVVDDLEKVSAFYCTAYGLHAVKRVRGERIAGEEIDEIMLAADPEAPFGNLVLLKYVDREAATTGEVLLGFVTDDLPALLDRIVTAGGRVHDPMREMPELGLRVAFAIDPEGHVAELVQLVS